MGQAKQRKEERLKAEGDEQLKVAVDNNAPQIAAFVWLTDGTCHQIMLTHAQRRQTFNEIERMHDFSIKISHPEIGILWPKSEPTEPKQ